jgi:lysozyme
MNYSQGLINLWDKFEGNELEAYPDPKTGGDPWTVGRGHTGPEVHEGTTITEEQSRIYFEDDMEWVVNTVNKNVVVPLTQNQFDALCSIIGNVGPGSRYKDGIIQLKNGQPSTLLKKLNTFDYQGAAAEFLKWDSPGSAVQHGLDNRRKAEHDLFLS